jgi:hypothetical protein
MNKLKYPRDCPLMILPAAKETVNPSPGQHSSNILSLKSLCVNAKQHCLGHMKQGLLVVL